MTITDIEVHRKIIQGISLFVDYINDEDKIFKTTLENSKRIVEKFERKTLIATNITKKELGVFKSRAFKYIKQEFHGVDFGNYYSKDKEYYELQDAIKRTLVGSPVMHLFIIHSRTHNYNIYHPIAGEISQTIKNEIIKTFYEKNKELITKYI